MKYYIFETEIANGEQAFATTVKESHNDAKMLFHQILASAYANKNCTYALVLVLDENGMNYERECYKKGSETIGNVVSPQATVL